MEQREFNLNGRHVDVVGSANNKAKTYLGQPTIGLRRYGWETSTEGSLRRKTGEKEKEEEKNKVEEFQLANPASLGSLASNELNCISATSDESREGKLTYLFQNRKRDKQTILSLDRKMIVGN